MNKKCIVRLAEGLGNQLFMYANAYAISKKLNYDLYLDIESGYFKKKNQYRKYELNKLNISGKIIKEKFIFNNHFLDLKRKFLLKKDFFTKKKLFITEKVDQNKKSFYFNYLDTIVNDNIILEGYFQSEKYFKDFRKQLINEFIVNKKFISKENNYINALQSCNSVSICLRRNRFSEGKIKNDFKSNQFTKNTIKYIYRSVDFIKKKLNDPKFFLWTNDFSDLNEYFDPSEYTYIKFNENKSVNDFNLFKYSKHFIVGPTSFHWWGAWLNTNFNKVCIRPSCINPSNNVDYWPKNWITV